MRIFENKKGMAETVDVAGVVTKVVERPASFESQFFRAIGVLAVIVIIISWVGPQLGITGTNLREGINAHNIGIWISLLLIGLFGAIVIRGAWNVAAGKETKSIFKTMKTEFVVLIMAFVMFAILSSGILSQYGLTILPP